MCIRDSSVDAPDFPYMRSRLYQLSRTVYERRKRILCISDASFYMVDAGRGLEHLLVLINELPAPLCRNDRDLLINVRSRLAAFHSFLQQETGGIPLIDSSVPAAPENSKTSVLFQNSLNYIRDRLLHMTDPQNRSRYRETSLSFRFRLMAALDLSPVRAVYALRTALVLSAAACLVQALGMPHGRWLLFTLASVSLPLSLIHILSFSKSTSRTPAPYIPRIPPPSTTIPVFIPSPLASFRHYFIL